MSEFRLTKQGLWDVLEAWDPYLPRKVRVVACGGTALALQDMKESTKDVDFLVPDQEEYKILLSTIQKLGYRQVTGSGWARDGGFVFDLFRGKVVFQAELLDSPLGEGMHIPIRVFKKLSVAALNDLDLEKLKKRCKETALYDLNPDRMMKNLDHLLAGLKGRK